MTMTQWLLFTKSSGYYMDHNLYSLFYIFLAFNSLRVSITTIGFNISIYNYKYNIFISYFVSLVFYLFYDLPKLCNLL